MIFPVFNLKYFDSIGEVDNEKSIFLNKVLNYSLTITNDRVFIITYREWFGFGFKKHYLTLWKDGTNCHYYFLNDAIKYTCDREDIEKLFKALAPKRFKKYKWLKI